MPSPRYSAIEVAKKLTELNQGAKLILGSATPDIQSYYEAKNSNSLFVLNKRFNNAELPKVKIVDMRMERGFGNNGIFSQYLTDEIHIFGNFNSRISWRWHGLFVGRIVFFIYYYKPQIFYRRKYGRAGAKQDFYFIVS